MSRFKESVTLALIQLATTADKAANLARARSKVLEAGRTHGAGITVLPECFNSPYGTQYFRQYAERLPAAGAAHASPTFDALAAMARDADTYLVGGSMPEYEPASGRHYNTCLVFSPRGELLATHRKIHLFDIDIPGRISFRESDVLSPGNSITVVDLPELRGSKGRGVREEHAVSAPEHAVSTPEHALSTPEPGLNNDTDTNTDTDVDTDTDTDTDALARVGIGICYDVRFPELATIAARRHRAFLLLYPGAFNLTTGPLHWELQARARALDNQLYVAMCSPARDLAAAYHAYGHSIVVDPNAEVVARAGHAEEIVLATLRPDRLRQVRRSIPLNAQRRFDVYPDVSADR